MGRMIYFENGSHLFFIVTIIFWFSFTLQEFPFLGQPDDRQEMQEQSDIYIYKEYSMEYIYCHMYSCKCKYIRMQTQLKGSYHLRKTLLHGWSILGNHKKKIKKITLFKKIYLIIVSSKSGLPGTN